MMRDLRTITTGLTVVTLLILLVLPAAGSSPVAAQQGTVAIQAGTTDSAFSRTAAPQFGQLPAHPASRDSCTREAMDRCEYSCMMPGGILDLYCYEDCIYTIC
jgi:hypothetical protein